MKTMYKLQTPSRYLVNGNDRLVVGDRFFEATEINGFASPAHRVLVTNTKTGEKVMYAPGKEIRIKIGSKSKSKKKKGE